MKRVLIPGLAMAVLVLSIPTQAGWFSWLFKKDTYTKTKYPIVLVHGVLGFDDILGIDYFYRVPAELNRSGAKVYTTQVASFGATESRGEALAQQVELIIAISGKNKVNLIGHSHGGPTARYVASVYPDMVASVTTVGGVNWGTKLADVATGVTSPIPFANNIMAVLANAVGSLVDFLSGGGFSQDYTASMADITTAGILQFNAKYPEGMPSQYCGSGNQYGSNGVRYYSWSGGGHVTSGIDPSDYLMLVTSVVFLGERNDGLISSCSSHLGKVIRDNYNMNHLDEINHVFGLHAIFETDPITVYRAQANRLKNAGL